MPGTSSAGSGEQPEPSRYRILLDQNFPKPPGFSISEIDDTVEVVHLADFDPSLVRGKTPDWLIYLRAAAERFDALVTRDARQLELAEELWILTRVPLTLITFRRAIEDPITEWGQLLSYLPIIRARAPGQLRSRVIYLPKPTLSEPGNITKSKDLLHRMAGDTGVSAEQLRSDAQANVRSYLIDNDLSELGTVIDLNLS